jgi:signal transduction histidine kinase
MDERIEIARILVNIQEEERRAVGRELHERLGQSLMVLKLLLAEAAGAPSERAQATLAEAQSLLAELMSLARNLSLELRPKMLDDLGLLAALLYLFESYSSRTEVNVVFEHYGLHRRFPPETGIAAYRIVQEALDNVAKHAGVQEARVLAKADRRILHIRIEDRGHGFEIAKLQADQKRGITGIRGRAMLVGGQVNFHTQPGKGTVVVAELPVTGLYRKPVKGVMGDQDSAG